MSHRLFPLALAACAALALPSAASAIEYPPPGNPLGATGKPAGKGKTVRVCKQRGCFPKIQQAVNFAKAGDTVKIADGTYRENVKISGSGKRFIKLVGNPKNPSKVVLDGATLKGAKAQNGVLINGANGVTVDGISTRNYKGNGFFVTNVTGYKLTNLRARRTGVYGIYAFNSKGGEMSNSEASEVNDAGFYIGQTPPQTKPFRSVVKNVKSHTNVIGFSGTNMRYVTITKSQWFNNGIGLVPNALDTEKFAPPEDNVIIDNDIYWNNFNYFKGAPFPLRKPATGEIAYPVGTGVLLFGGRRTTVENNRIFGNYLFGFGALKQIILKQANAADLIGNEIKGNQFGLGGEDRNGREMFYDGSGSDNCFAGNTGVETTVPAVGSPAFAPCPFKGANAEDGEARSTVVGWAFDEDREKNWIKHPHKARPGQTPLERYSK